ncbi:sulfite exporter TauE/SafE family protein 5-like isoform X2 [Malania oleifera]|uniref:sulfite exporter TauE/SafE family protein 5-like isoform X2 n=1 Tax=Malania oleifera TaxID=397392 RepID=UPI0025AE9CCF|nr:sulfite exporter TauE/SafE family protein 5-like isoform X2 [Malania oleifera]
MKGFGILPTLILLPCVALLICNHSQAKPAQPISQILKFDKFNLFRSSTLPWRSQGRESQETHLRFAAPVAIAGVLCFLAASISSAGGIGGGGLFIPILTIVAGLDLKMASSFSAFMVTGGSLANVLRNMFVTTCPRYGGKTLIDYDIALLSEPCILLGVSIGVICNLVFPEWLITILFVVFLGWCTLKTFRNGILCWKSESEEVGNLGNGLVGNGICHESGGVECSKDPLLSGKGDCKVGIPRMKLGLLVMVWLSFFIVYFLRANQLGESIIQMQPCGVNYWILSSFQIPLAIIFTTWIICRNDIHPDQTSNLQMADSQTSSRSSNKLIFPIMALLAGILGGLFGIGGGMLLSPLLLHVGMAPENLLMGMEHTDAALVFAIICFVASLLGLMVVQRAIEKYGRASLIIFSVGTVMALSTILITSFGAVDVWRDYTTGKYMGFKLPC